MDYKGKIKFIDETETMALVEETLVLSGTSTGNAVVAESPERITLLKSDFSGNTQDDEFYYDYITDGDLVDEHTIVKIP